MGNFYLYAAAFFGHWWPLVTAGSVFGLEAIAEQNSWASEQLSKIPNYRRGQVRIAASLVGVIVSGYLAWSDEHAALIEANNNLTRAASDLAEAKTQLSQKMARMDFLRLEPEIKPLVEINNETKQDIYLFKVWFHNVGQAAAQSVSLRSVPVLSDTILSSTEEEKNMDYIKSPGAVSDNDVQPGDSSFYYANSGLLGPAFDKFLQRKQYLYLFTILTYHDEASNKPIITEICRYFSNNDLNNWQYCASGHNKITRQN